jgi:small-conductance mechanosensitive channel
MDNVPAARSMAGQQQQQQEPGTPAGRSGLPAGVIAAIVVGGIVLLLVIVFAVLRMCGLLTADRPFKDKAMTLLERFVHIMLIIGIAILVQQMVAFIIAEHIQHQKENETGMTNQHQTLALVGTSAATWVVSLIACMSILERMCVPLKTLLAVSGIGALVVGIGARSIIRDFFASLILVTEGTIYRSEEVILHGAVINMPITGLVENITLRVTEIRTQDGSLITVPNGNVTAISNLSRGAHRVRVDIEVLAKNADLGLFQKLRQYVDRSRNMAHIQNISALGVTKIFTDKVTFTIIAMTDAHYRWEVEDALSRGAWRVLSNENIKGARLNGRSS